MEKVILAGGPSFALFNPSLHVSLGGEIPPRGNHLPGAAPSFETISAIPNL